MVYLVVLQPRDAFFLSESGLVMTKLIILVDDRL